MTTAIAGLLNVVSTAIPYYSDYVRNATQIYAIFVRVAIMSHCLIRPFHNKLWNVLTQ